MKVVASLLIVLAALTSTAVAQTDRPAVGPERPFQLAPRVEKTLPNGLRVVVTRQTAVPKVTAADVQQAAKRYLTPANRTSIDRRPGGGAQ